MEYEFIKPLVEAIIGVVAIIITGYLIPWLKGKIGEAKFDKLSMFAALAIRTAEQIFAPEQWQEKKNYVLNYVSQKAQEIGVNVSADDIENLIEGLVNEIKKG